jgi:hypothetical protein
MLMFLPVMPVSQKKPRSRKPGKRGGKGIVLAGDLPGATLYSNT